MARVLLIVNPHATRVSPELRERVVRELARGTGGERGCDVEARLTQAPGHAVELARHAGAEGFDAVATLGGDGTVNEAACGLIEAGGHARLAPVADPPGGSGARGNGSGASGRGTPALACLPGGQANVFARMLELPDGAIAASRRVAEAMNAGRGRTVDLGVVNERCFTFASGLGLDAWVTRQVDARPRLKARLGPWYYTWSVLAVLARRCIAGAPKLSVRVDGEGPLEGMTAIVQNGSPYTYFKRRPIDLAENSALDSGRLSGCVLRRALPHDLPSLAWRALSKGASVGAHPRVSPFSQARALTVASSDGRALPLQADGEYLGEVTEARYTVLPGALKVLC
jgi:diacylglycerol kinase family enzyme